MKKFRFFLMTSVALMVAFSGCKKNEIEGPDNPENYVGTFKLTEIVDAAAGAYAAWEETESFAETIKVGSKDLKTPEYQYAICKALVNLSAGKKDDIDVLSFKAAEHPDRDSYDKETIAVANGPKVGEDTEDLVNVATRMIARMESDLRVPNQTNFTRGDNAVAFSTERATTVISRELANYKKGGKLDAEVDAGFKGAGSSIQAFAKEYVKIIDIWEKNVGTLDRLSNWELAEDGDADIVENAHYVPNNTEIRIGETVLNTADMLEVAVRSYLLLRGYDGNAVDAVGFGSFAAATPANMNTPMPATHQYGWNKPLIETSNGGYLCKVIDEIDTYGQVDVVILDNWAQRSLNFSFTNDMMWTNFCTYPRADHNITNYKGCFSSGRALLTYAFFFKYLLDNNITKDIDKIGADVVIRSELFGIDTANNDKDIQLKDTELEFPCTEETKEAMFAAKAAWTATPSADWITVEPASGEAGAITIKVKVAENKGDAREGSVVVKGGNVTDGVAITVKQAEYTAPNTATIKEFAQEYVKILDVWQNTTGTIDMLKGEDYEGGNNKVENAHYVPSTTTITVGTKTYNTADMLELALRSYLFIRGYDGADTKNYGAGKIAALDGGAKAMSETVVPDTHEYKWGANPYNETGTYDVATGATTSNGGHFIKIVDGAAVHCQTDPTLLDNWAMRALNYSSGNPISNMCTYPRDPFNNYAGSFSSMRALITYAFFFKYMLDNSLDKADGLDATVNIRTELFGDEGEPEPQPVITIADFANEYVKILDVWMANVGEKKMHSSVAATKNAHFIPDDYTITVKDKTGKVEKTYNTADMFETALRSYLLIRGYDGLDTEKYGAGKIPAIDTAKAMSTTPVPETHGYQWGEAPCNETSGNGGNFAMIGANKFKDFGWAKVDVLDNWAMRSLNYSHGKPITNMCTYPRADQGITNYHGSFSSMRALITYAYFFKYMLNKKYDKGTQVTADETFRTDLFGVDGQQLARWEFSAAAAGKEGAYGYTFGGAPTMSNGAFNGNEYTSDATAGDGGQYIDANWNGNGRITYVQIDKTGMEGGTSAGHNVGSTGHVCTKAPWTGDYWLFKANSASELAAGTKIHFKYIFRSSKSGPGYFLVEYKDGSEWKPASLIPAAGEETEFAFPTVQSKTIGSDTFSYNARTKKDGNANTTVESVFELTSATSTVEIRATIVATNRADNDKALTKLNTGTTRLAGSTVNVNGAFTSPIIEIAQFAE